MSMLHAAVDRAGQLAGPGDSQWNVRYRAALAAEGLSLIPYHGEQLYNDSMCAPYPVDGPEAWAPSIIRFTAGIPI